MMTRALEMRDLPVIEQMYADSAFCFDWPQWPDPQYENATVVVDDCDRPIMLCAAVKRVELYLLAGDADPYLKLEALSLLHETVRREMAAKGIKKGFAFLQPGIAKAFGRRLERMFRWEFRNDPVYLIRGD